MALTDLVGPPVCTDESAYLPSGSPHSADRAACITSSPLHILESRQRHLRINATESKGFRPAARLSSRSFLFAETSLEPRVIWHRHGVEDEGCRAVRMCRWPSWNSQRGKLMLANTTSGLLWVYRGRERQISIFSFYIMYKLVFDVIFLVAYCIHLKPNHILDHHQSLDTELLFRCIKSVLLLRMFVGDMVCMAVLFLRRSNLLISRPIATSRGQKKYDIKPSTYPITRSP